MEYLALIITLVIIRDFSLQIIQTLRTMASNRLIFPASMMWEEIWNIVGT